MLTNDQQLHRAKNVGRIMFEGVLVENPQSYSTWAFPR